MGGRGSRGEGAKGAGVRRFGRGEARWGEGRGVGTDEKGEGTGNSVWQDGSGPCCVMVLLPIRRGGRVISSAAGQEREVEMVGATKGREDTSS